MEYKDIDALWGRLLRAPGYGQDCRIIGMTPGGLPIILSKPDFVSMVALDNRTKPTHIINEFLYEIPMEKVPLYINDPLLGIYARWRLENNR